MSRMDNAWINNAVGAELRAARARRDWSRDELAERSGVPAATLRRYEDGTRTVPVTTLVALVRALGIGIDDIGHAIQRASPDNPELGPTDTRIGAAAGVAELKRQDGIDRPKQA